MQIPLTKGYVAQVDLEDFERFGNLKWTAQVTKSGKVYAFRKASASSKNIYLHRLILGVADGVLVDHEDGDGLNCRRSNLRPATYFQNRCNSKPLPNAHGFIGVHRAASGRYFGRVNARGKDNLTRTFPCAILAAAARDVLARQIHGEFATLNFQFIPLAA